MAYSGSALSVVNYIRAKNPNNSVCWFAADCEMAITIEIIRPTVLMYVVKLHGLCL